MSPIRQHGRLMKNRAEKAGGHVKKKRKMLVGILAALPAAGEQRISGRNHCTA